jgi:uncharacterized membrane protein
MDIVAHALWTTAAARGAREKWNTHIHLGWAAFWGIFPDVFSFAIPAVVRIWWYATGVTSSLKPDAHSAPRFQFVWQLYHCSHSLLVFAVVFGVVWGIAERPVLELLGWGLHILIDIATHRGIFAIHFLWPLSAYGFNGIRWENSWFLAANYGALLVLFGWIWMRSKKKQSPPVHRGAKREETIVSAENR